MITSPLKHILKSPDTGQPLAWDEFGESLKTTDGLVYPVKNGVPILVPTAQEEVVADSQQHEQRGTHFHYLDHYQKDAEVFDYFQEFPDGASIHENQRLHETIIRSVPTNATHILDVGCGKAWVSAHFCPKGKTVYSMDISTVNPVKAIQKYPFENHFGVVADVFSLPFQANAFDCIIASEIIEHVPDPRTFIARLVEVLKPGGKLIITTPYKEKIVHHLCVHCNHPTPENAHLHSFDENILMDICPDDQLKDKGYQIFSNKYLTKLRTHILMKHLPYSIWKGVDRMSNGILGQPTRILIWMEKK